MNDDIRWKQRFANFSKAYMLLKTPLDGKFPEDFDDLQQEGLIQRFEYTFELLWKTMKDFLDYEEVPIEIISPKNVIKAAAVSNLLEKINIDGDILLDMLKSRNLLSHTYDSKNFKYVLDRIKANYISEIDKVYEYFRGKL
ncbi:MAG: nucleotidyltransferase substrate binding protein [Clostridiales bacterium]|jgi:nucleotidyltransferase substrate binding protein (TIGR01987 family)|nr:nucleotidyltransferase substrate binding protein [Clostridiales bacterium]